MDPTAGQNPASSKRPDLFISFQKSDEEFATKLASAIESSSDDLTVFFAPWDIAPGKNIVKELDAGLDKARFFGLVLSPDYLQADWTLGESSAAIWADPAGRLGRVIPIMHVDCQLPPLLRFRRYVDFRALTFDTGVSFIVSVLQGKPLSRSGHGSGQTEALSSNSDVTVQRTLLDAALPDRVPEQLYPNVFSCRRRPRSIWSAPTRFRGGTDVFRYYGPDREVPPFILAAGRLYTFADLSVERHPFVGVVEDYDRSSESWESWTIAPGPSNRLHWLLDDCLREKMRSLRMSYSRKGRKFYYEQGVLGDQKFRAFERSRGKGLVIDYAERGGTYSAHRAVNFRFLLLGSEPFLRVESGWVFKDLTGDLIEGRRRIVLNSKFTSGQRNAANFNEIRFWTWFLADEDSILRLPLGAGQSLEVDMSLSSIPTDFGILGDSHALSPVRDPPDLRFEDEDEDHSLDLPVEGDSDDGEDSE